MELHASNNGAKWYAKRVNLITDEMGCYEKTREEGRDVVPGSKDG